MERKTKDEHDIAVIPYLVYEDVADRFERTQTNLRFVAVVALLQTIGLVFALIAGIRQNGDVQPSRFFTK